MAYRCVTIGGLKPDAYSYLIRKLSAAAAIGNLGFKISDQKQPIEQRGLIFRSVKKYHIVVEIWSDNEGSVHAICDQFLIPVAQIPEYFQIIDKSTEYIDGVKRWLANECNR